MGGGNGQKSKAARDKAQKRDAKPKGSQLAANVAACNIVCQVRAKGSVRLCYI
jgi:hypothetical protein